MNNDLEAICRALGMHAAITAPMCAGVVADAERYAAIFTDFALGGLGSENQASAPPQPQPRAHLSLVADSEDIERAFPVRRHAPLDSQS